MLQMESSDEKAPINLHLLKAELLLRVQELWDTNPLHLMGGKVLCIGGGEGLGLCCQSCSRDCACCRHLAVDCTSESQCCSVVRFFSVFFCHSVISCISGTQCTFPIVIIFHFFEVQNGKMCPKNMLLSSRNCLVSAFSHLPHPWECL